MPPAETANRGSNPSGAANTNSSNNATASTANNSHTANSNTQEPVLQKWWGILALILRILLWPLRRLSQWTFPPGDFDGLSAPVTAKAAQQFVSYLRQLQRSTTGNNNALEPWSTTGFAALQAQLSQNSPTSPSVVLVYLHSPLHRRADEFCRTMLLNNPTVVTFLRQPTLACLGLSIHTAQGMHLAQGLAATAYPCLALLQPKPGPQRPNSTASATMNIVFKAEGPTLMALRPETLLQYLNVTIQRHQAVLAEQEARRILRQQESELRRQQDEEYQEALLADQERERQQQLAQEEEARRVAEAEQTKQHAEQHERNRIQSAKALLRPEPTSGGTKIRFTLPTGTKLDRRFESDETVASLKAFLMVHFSESDHPSLQQIRNIGLSTNFPKKTYHELDDQTLAESGLSPQALLMVQDLDA